MKRLGLISIALLAGCVPTQKEYTIIRETSRPVVQAEEQTAPVSQVVIEETKTLATTPTQTTNTTTACSQTTANGQPACMQPAPTYFAGTYNQPQGVYQTQQHIAYQSGGCGGQVMCGHNLASTLGGTVMNMPAQTMQVAAMPMQMPTQPVQPQQITLPLPTMPTSQMVQTEVFYETQTMPMNAQIMGQMPAAVQAQLATVSEVILQHPMNRDLVKCTFGDVNCIMAYQAQGYVQLQNAPITPNATYAISGAWQDNNNIPRW